jgi:hypothetical protein
MATRKFDCERGIVVEGRDKDFKADGYNNRGDAEISLYNQQPQFLGETLRLFTFCANLLSSPLMRSSYPSSDDSSLGTLPRDLLRFLSTAAAGGIPFCCVGRGGGSGDTLTARTVLLADEPLLSAETCRCEALAAGRIVLELSSETFPAKVFGGDNFRGEAGFFFGESGGRGGMGGFGGGWRSKPPSKSLSQSSSSVVGGVPWLPM